MLTTVLSFFVLLFGFRWQLPIDGAVTGPFLYDLFPHSDESCEVEIYERPVESGSCSARDGNLVFETTVYFNVRNTGKAPLPVPYSLSVRNLEYIFAKNPFNLDLDSTEPILGELHGSVANPQLGLGANGSSTASFGFTVTAQTNDTVPTRVLLNSTPCTLLIQNSTTSQEKEVAQQLTTRDGEIIGSDGVPIDLKGIAWFGFDDANTMVDGLWKPEAGTNLPNGIRMELTTVLQRLQLLGFNALRVPFSFTDLFTTDPRNFTDNCTHPTDAELLDSVTPPDMALIPENATLPDALEALLGLPEPLRSPPGVCNAFLPGSSTLNRFLWFLQYVSRQGFYIVIVNQANEDFIFKYSPQQWLLSWRWLMEAIQQNIPEVFPRLIVDPVNEPEIQGVRWEDDPKTGSPGMATLYLRILDMLFKMQPDLLFFIQGTGQASSNLVTTAGDGFVVDPQLLAMRPNASDPNIFFQPLLEKPYLEQVVISPHLYPPSVSGEAQLWRNYTSSVLWRRFSNSFGHFNSGNGYCSSTTGKCHKFPVVVGEFGSRFETPADIQAMYDLAEYMHNIGDAEDGRHSRIGSWFYWAFNANSADTGGLVDDNWEGILWDKIEYLEYLGLRPWYLPKVEPTTLIGIGENGTFTDDVEENPQRPNFTLVEPPACSDKAPDNMYSCEDQKGFGKCDAGFIVSGNYCLATCGRCPENGTFIYELKKAGPAAAPGAAHAAGPPSTGVGLQPSQAPTAAAAPRRKGSRMPTELNEFQGTPHSGPPISGTLTEGLHSQTQGPVAKSPRGLGRSCSVDAQTTAWEAAAGPQAAISLSLDLAYGALAAPWNLTLLNPAYNSAVQAYNWDLRESSEGVISGVVSNQTLEAGRRVSLLVIADVQGGRQLAPEAAFLNGLLQCEIVPPACSFDATFPGSPQQSSRSYAPVMSFG